MKITIAKGVTVKEIVLLDGTPLLKVAHGLTGITVPHPFCSVENDLAEVMVDANFTFITDHAIDFEISVSNVVVSDAKEIFFKLVI